MQNEQEMISTLLKVFGEYSFANHHHFSNILHLPVKLPQFSVRSQRDFIQKFEMASGGSCKTKRNLAFIAGTCEFLERYSLRFNKIGTEPLTIEEASKIQTCLNLETLREFQGISDFQFNLATINMTPLNEATKFIWVKARRLFTAEEVLVPQELVVLKHNRLFEVTTNGCAIGQTEDQAILGGAYELIERHLVMNFWWRKINPFYFDIEGIVKNHLPHIHYAFGPWLKHIRLLSIPNEIGIPFFMTYFVGENKKRQPAFLMSAACHLDPVKAIERTLCELASIMNHQMSKFPKAVKTDVLKTGNFDLDIDSFEDHQKLYIFDESKDWLFFLNRDHNDKALLEDFKFEKPDGRSELDLLKDKLRKAGLNPLVIDQTTRDVASLGLTVRRVFDSQVVDLNSRHVRRRWGKKGLFKDGINSVFDLNQFPHPFP